MTGVGGGGGGLPSIPGVLAHWDFSNPLTQFKSLAGSGAKPTVTGDPVGWVQDLSGNANHLLANADTGVRETLLTGAQGGYPCVQSDGTSQYYLTTTLLSRSVFSCVAVMQPSAASVPIGEASFGVDGCGFLAGGQRNTIKEADFTLVASSNASFPPNQFNQFQVIEWALNGSGANNHFWVNGTQYDWTDNSTTSPVNFSGIDVNNNVVQAATKKLRIIIFDHYLLTAERVALNASLRAIYQI